MLTFAFYKAPGTWRDRLIRLATRSQYSHVEFVLRRYEHQGQDRMFCVSASKRDGHRVRKASIPIQPDHWDFVTVEGDYADAMMLAGSLCGFPTTQLARSFRLRLGAGGSALACIARNSPASSREYLTRIC